MVAASGSKLNCLQKHDLQKLPQKLVENSSFGRFFRKTEVSGPKTEVIFGGPQTPKLKLAGGGAPYKNYPKNSSKTEVLGVFLGKLKLAGGSPYKNYPKN